jgi:hypothetical protein
VWHFNLHPIRQYVFQSNSNKFVTTSAKHNFAYLSTKLTCDLVSKQGSPLTLSSCIGKSFQIYTLTATGLPAGGSSTVHIYTQPPGGSSTVHIYTQRPGGSSTVHIYTQTPGGSSTVHIYTQTIHRTIQNKQYIEQHNNFGRVLAVPRLG